ncbi:DnaJ domain-containing protein [Hydrogenophaga sp. PAMC20947]|uniref:J domain-containing protein n=1 Tax=Hydrogenophaga sp. PAMC20947 TaxID=2565558 RepID=UPI001445415E|nr:DnaJ domain-containing protein [Hydrogenophaga sp. PAMC20947]
MSTSPTPATLWSPAADLSNLVQTLLDFEQQPGRFALALREPHVLFDHTQAVMLLAAGRPVEGLPPLMPGQHTGAVQRAARFFVRTVLLRPGTDHYSVLGLQPDHGPEALRDHYRLMIRLTHPDFAGAGDEWPADAASRINLANDVLSSVVKRSEYDAHLATGFTAPGMAVKPVAAHATAAHPPAHASAHTVARGFESDDESDARVRRRRRTQKMALAAAGAVACAALLWLLSPGHNDSSLVAQRPNGNTTNAANNRSSNSAPMSAIEQAKAELAADAALAREAAGAGSGTGIDTPNPAPDTATKTTKTALALGPTATATATATATDTNTGTPPAAPARRAPVRTRVEFANAAQAPADTASSQPARTWRMKAAPENDNATNNDGDDNSRLALALETRLSLTSIGTTSVTPPSNSLPTLLATTANKAQTPATATPAAATAPTGAPDPVSPTPPTSAPASPAVETGAARLTMAQVQVKLSQVLSGLQTGKAENAVQWLEGHWRDHPAASNFVTAYQRQLAGQRVVQMGKVLFRSRHVAEHFVVDGVVELVVQDDKQVEQVKELNMSAYFLAKDGRPVLTQLVLNRAR